jgi:predicted porin
MEIHMKKSLLALAVLSAVAGVASAQSSVTLYGLVDIGVGRLDPKQSGVASTTGVVSGIQSGSRVGLRGSEDLGGGLKAIFNLEHGFSADDGTQGQGRMWGRWAWAGVEGGFGQVRLGRQWAAGFELFGAVDPWGTGFNDAGSQSVFASANAIRVNNAIVYRSPIVGGFGAVVGYSTTRWVRKSRAARMPTIGRSPLVCASARARSWVSLPWSAWRLLVLISSTSSSARPSTPKSSRFTRCSARRKTSASWVPACSA